MKEQLTISRRGFLEKTILTGAALGLTPDLLQGAEEAPSFGGRKIKVGHIGCGNVSGSYLPNLTSKPYIEVVSVRDLIPERAQKRSEQFKVPNVYTSIDDML